METGSVYDIDMGGGGPREEKMQLTPIQYAESMKAFDAMDLRKTGALTSLDVRLHLCKKLECEPTEEQMKAELLRLCGEDVRQQERGSVTLEAYMSHQHGQGWTVSESESVNGRDMTPAQMIEGFYDVLDTEQKGALSLEEILAAVWCLSHLAYGDDGDERTAICEEFFLFAEQLGRKMKAESKEFISKEEWCSFEAKGRSITAFLGIIKEALENEQEARESFKDGKESAEFQEAWERMLGEL